MLRKNTQKNQNKDISEMEVEKEASELAVLAITALAAAFFCVQIATGGGMNYGLWALLFAGNGTTYWVKYKKLRKEGTLFWAIGHIIVTLLLSVMHIYTLVMA